MREMLLEWVSTSIFLILTVLALRVAFGRRVSARLRYALWAVVLVRLLIPVQLFTSPIAGTRVLSEHHAERNIYRATDEGLEQGGPEDILALGGQDGPSAALTTFPQAPGAPVPPDAPALPDAPDLTRAPGWLGWIWLGGSIAVALMLLAFNLRFALGLRRRRTLLEGAECPLRVYTAAGLPSPCLFGLVRPAVYVTPEAAADSAILRHVAAHEYTHYRHGDHLWSLLRCAALAAHWWDPLVWLAVVLSRRDGELACDEGALARLGDGERLAYGNTLLALVTAKPGPGELLCFATTMAGEKRSLKERISRIACAPKRWLWAAAAVVLVTVLACACAFGSAEEPGDGSGAGPAPGDLAADLSFSIDYGSDGPFVRIEGAVGSTAIKRAIWYPEGQDALFGEHYGGELSMAEYEFAGGGGAWLNAWWTDESRTSVTATTYMSAMLSSYLPTGYWMFTIDVSGETALVTQMTAHCPQGFSDAQMRMLPEAISDEDAVAAARIAAKVMTAAEDYYRNAMQDKLRQDAELADPANWTDLPGVTVRGAGLGRNGVRETIKVMDIPGEDGERPSGHRVGVFEGDRLVWMDEAYYNHGGWNAVFLCHLSDGDDPGDYLLRYDPVMYQGSANYSYTLFTLEGGKETVVESGQVGFAIGLSMHDPKRDCYDFSPEDFDPNAIDAFMAQINHLLYFSTPLINTDGSLLSSFEEEGALYDHLCWLDDFRDPDLPLINNLVNYRAYLDPYSIPTVRTLGDMEFELSYHGEQTRFRTIWDQWWQPDPDPKMMDLDGDGRDEIVLTLIAGHGTGAYAESLCVFDAETLKQYDTPDVWEDIVPMIGSTADEEYFYLSAPGTERVVIPKRSVMGERPEELAADEALFDSIVFGSYYWYDWSALEDGKLICCLLGYGSPFESCCQVDVELELVDGEIRCGGFTFVETPDNDR